MLAGPSLAQETKQETKAASGQAKVAPVTQEQLNAADKNGKDFGIGRPYMGRDPPHCAPIDGEEYAKHQPGRATRQASLATARKLVMATH